MIRTTISQVSPQETWRELTEVTGSALVDVRTQAEWNFVGVPDTRSVGRTTAFVEWRKYPVMAVNQGFLPDLEAALDGDMPERLYFICRSGARSLEAAGVVQSAMDERGTPVQCFNVAEGFEGDLDADGHRGLINGWKAHGLPWRQS